MTTGSVGHDFVSFPTARPPCRQAIPVNPIPPLPRAWMAKLGPGVK